MAKMERKTTEDPRLANISHAFLSIEQLHEETRLLFESITAKTRQVRADAKTRKPVKTAARKH
jgi:hypothetical protein